VSIATRCRIQVVADLSPKPATKSTILATKLIVSATVYFVADLSQVSVTVDYVGDLSRVSAKVDFVADLSQVSATVDFVANVYRA